MNSVSSDVRMMRCCRVMLLYGSLLLLGCQPLAQADTTVNETPPNEPAANVTALDEMLAQASQGGSFVVPSPQQLEQASDLFERTLRGETLATLGVDWQQLGFKLDSYTVDHAQWWILQDIRKQGGGFYVFRHDGRHNPWPVALQAPHSFHDLRTRELALLLMQQGGFVAAAWNTVHRYGGGEHSGQHAPADVAHTDNSYFQAFTRAFARRYPHGAILQLHGFVQQKRKTEEGRSADMVLSTGSMSVTSSLLQLNQCFRQQFIGVSRLFPMDIHELGATTNRNASMLRAMDFTGFVHVEMSAPLRKKLVEVKFLRERMLSCIREVWG